MVVDVFVLLNVLLMLRVCRTQGCAQGHTAPRLSVGATRARARIAPLVGARTFVLASLLGFGHWILLLARCSRCCTVFMEEYVLLLNVGEQIVAAAHCSKSVAALQTVDHLDRLQLNLLH